MSTRRTTAPAQGVIPAQPGPQAAHDSANGAIPGAGPTGQTPGGPTGRTPGGPTGRTPGGPTGRTPGGPTGQTPGGPTGRTPGGPTGRTPAGPTGEAPGGPTGQAPGGPTGQAPGGPAGQGTGGPAARAADRPGAWPGEQPAEQRGELPGERTASGVVAAPGEDRANRPANRPAEQLTGSPEQLTGGPGQLTGRPGQPPAGRATVRLREGAGQDPEPRPGAEAAQGPVPEHPADPPRYAPEWLRLREPADAAARAHDLLDPLRIRLANLPGRADGLVVHDVGCGTGSMGRWLAPLLDGPQHWVLHDRDPYLLHFAAVAAPRTAADGSRVTVETRRGDLARLTPDALTGAALVTASALLDVLSTEQVGKLAAACAAAGCPALLTLSVAGHVDLAPVHPLDAEITEAFNDHQRRTGMLGPDAVTAAAEAFAEHGVTVRAHPSPWRLGPDDAGLTAQWLRGWVGAAVEQRPELRERAARYLDERLAACAAGELRVVVHHTDLLALCRPTGGAP